MNGVTGTAEPDTTGAGQVKRIRQLEGRLIATASRTAVLVFNPRLWWFPFATFLRPTCR